MPGKIVVKGARVHNLKNIDVALPRDSFVVITGVSGSGKSSLAFDTLYAEGQRRYLESLAADTRQFFQQLEKPDVDSIAGLSPTIAIQLTSAVSSPRSTVGTMTEIYDYLRLLYARVGQPTCVQCGRDIRVQTTGQIIDRLLLLPAQTRIVVMAPMVSASRGEAEEKLRDVARQGFVRVMIGGKLHELSQEIRLETNPPYQVDLIVDRLAVRDGIERRLADSVEIASRFGDGVIKVAVGAANDSPPAEVLVFSQKFACVVCGTSLPEITPRLFSFNSPHGACPACGGLGVDAAPRRGPGEAVQNAQGAPCPRCHGTRLKPESLSVKLGGRNIAEVTALPVGEAVDLLRQLKLGEKESVIGAKVLDEIVSRGRFLIQLGLGYLTLDRPSFTLSGGEAQRVRLATHIGSGLAGVLYILDEPSIGLHQRDNRRLLAILERLRDCGNSVLVVEHDQETIMAADYVVDMGPGAGVNGGEVVAQGTPAELMDIAASLTGQYLSGRTQINVPATRRKATGDVLVVHGARENNLKNLTVEFPVGAMTCVTGVSGSGKSSLIMDTLYNAMAQRLHHSRARAGEHDALIGWQQFDRAVGVDQAPIGRSPRSNPATYTGAYEQIRDLFAQLPEARVRGYKADRFSFNVRGGRCDACAGDGIIRIDMYFLPEVFVPCDVCKGRRYNRETLEIKYKGLSIADVLDLTVNQALELFNAIPTLAEKLRTLRDVGLGYLRLGQPAPSLSGGEAQRVKLARELARKSAGRCLYVLDEPTSGLHFNDVKQLLEVLGRLTGSGNTVVIIEHNLDVIKSADYIIDLGPEGGANGGWIVARGTPEEVARAAGSYTGEYLKRVLADQPMGISEPDRASPPV
ncbi:MAG TPA: excinuclease ABC subunit UvrA [Candidatus Binatia bacterium]|nr:excinuclease ABC subunit UvrA [Candidatus Binatia bacterium]